MCEKDGGIEKGRVGKEIESASVLLAKLGQTEAGLLSLPGFTVYVCRNAFINSNSSALKQGCRHWVSEWRIGELAGLGGLRRGEWRMEGKHKYTPFLQTQSQSKRGGRDSSQPPHPSLSP